LLRSGGDKFPELLGTSYRNRWGQDSGIGGDECPEYALLKRGIKLIENGDELPVEWAREFFPPERREYELIYHGKDSEEKILADTMAVPLQPVSTFGTNGDDWHNMLILGDNLQAMKTLIAMKEQGDLVNADGSPGIRLIYIDPPFATKRDFRGSQDQKAYQDKIEGAEFLEFLRKRLIFLKALLSRDGTLYLHLDWKKGHYVKVLLDEIFGEQNFVNEIIWQKIRSSKGQAKSFGNVHDTIFCYAKSINYLYNKQYKEHNPERLKTHYNNVEEKTGRIYQLADFTQSGQGEPRYFGNKLIKPPNGKHWIWSQDKINEGIKNGIIVFTSGGRPRVKRYLDESEGAPVEDIWNDIAPMNSQSQERLDYPTQKPEKLIERIINASSNKGDLVLDAFIGSGTTCAVAEKLNRRWIGIDCGKLAVYTVQKRILNLRAEIGNSGKSLHSKPFKFYNAGLYDFETLRQLPWSDWRFFALQLFECKDEPHKIRGFQMDGKRQGSSVLVFNHFDKGTVSRETISDIHANIGKQVGERCFIIAPRGAFLFQEDYIELDAVRYYALRIPYSYINELHRREFSALTQPSDETAVNETVEAVGFDFIQPPLVELEIKERGGSASIKIKKFESKARLRGEDKISKHDALSMVMVDFDYNGKVFDLDRVFYADVLKNNSWKIEFSLKDVTGDVMLVFLDIYGNESRMIIEQKKLAGKAKRPKRRSHK
jgi:DNA modification methylase